VPAGVDPNRALRYEPAIRSADPLIVVLAAFILLVACTSRGADAPGGQDTERRSQAEFDVANDLWQRRGRAREALDHALQAVELDEGNADASHLVALIYLDFCRIDVHECRLQEAERFARLAIEARPDYREAKNTLGVILIHQRRYDDAIGVLKPLTADILYTTPENAWGNLGWAYLERGQIDPAIDALRRSVAAQPLFCVGNFRLGLAHERKRQLVPALEAYSRALNTDHPGCQGLQDAYAGRGRILMKLGRPEEARSDLTRCAELEDKSKTGKECGSMLDKLK
jgi:type IV pilus assembly protein PilF